MGAIVKSFGSSSDISALTAKAVSDQPFKDVTEARLKTELEFNLNIYNYPLDKYMESATAVVQA